VKFLKKLLSLFLDVLPHLTLALAFVLLVCFVIDRFNQAMAFINHDLTKWTLALLCVLVITESIVYIVKRRSGK